MNCQLEQPGYIWMKQFRSIGTTGENGVGNKPFLEAVLWILFSKHRLQSTFGNQSISNIGFRLKPEYGSPLFDLGQLQP